MSKTYEGKVWQVRWRARSDRTADGCPLKILTVTDEHSLHDDDWTQRLVIGRTNELDNLAELIEARR